jgi:hypothetical protein
MKMESYIGQKIVAVTGLEAGSDELTFEMENGDCVVFYHSQACCESVAISEVHGDASDLVGEVLLSFEEAVSAQDEKPSEWAESWTWTFYHFRTIKGTVTVRWLGESNGWYSESVDCKVIKHA